MKRILINKYLYIMFGISIVRKKRHNKSIMWSYETIHSIKGEKYNWIEFIKKQLIDYPKSNKLKADILSGTKIVLKK